MTEAATTRKPVKEPYFGLGLTITGIIIGILWVITFNGHPPQEGSVYAQGTVIDQDISAKGICEPIAVDGVTYRSPNGLGAEPCEHELGDPIEVAYHPDDIGGTLQIPHDEKDARQVIVISLPGWVLLIASIVSLVNNIRYRRSVKRARA